MFAIPLPSAPSHSCPTRALSTARSPLPPLVEYLARVPDRCGARGKRHPLPAVLALVRCALLCGERYLQAIVEWGRSHSLDLAWALGFS